MPMLSRHPQRERRCIASLESLLHHAGKHRTTSLQELSVCVWLLNLTGHSTRRSGPHRRLSTPRRLRTWRKAVSRPTCDRRHWLWSGLRRPSIAGTASNWRFWPYRSRPAKWRLSAPDRWLRLNRIRHWILRSGLYLPWIHRIVQSGLPLDRVRYWTLEVLTKRVSWDHIIHTAILKGIRTLPKANPSPYNRNVVISSG